MDRTTAAPAFATWLDEFSRDYYRTRPVNATFIGVHDHDERLPDLSPGGIDAARAAEAALLRGLHALPAEALTAAEALDRQFAEGVLEIHRWEWESGHFWWGNPCFYTGEAIFGALSIFLRPFAPLPRRVDAAIARLDAVPQLLDQARANLRAAPAAWIARASEECVGALAFCRGGVEILQRDEGFDEPRLRRAADRAAAVFATFRHWLEVDLRRRANTAYACGRDALDLLLRSGHFLDRDAAAVERYAAEQFAEAAGYLREHAADFGAATPAQALARLEEAHPAAGDYYARYDELWSASRAVAEREHLLTWPDYPLRFVPQPRWAREAAPHLYFLFYRAPAPFDAAPVVDYLVTPVEPDLPPEERERRLRATNDSVIKLNHVAHHGGIGHHVQNWHARRAASRLGRIAAVDCASRIALLCGGTMAEGWACYATGLLAATDFVTPLERYAERHTRLRMAARALVDVRLHTGAFTLEQAAAFYQREVGLSLAAAVKEAVKNSMFPGTALMYLAGADQIRELRREVAARLGAGFDLRRFHDRLLSFGSVPVALAGRVMREEVAGVQGAAR